MYPTNHCHLCNSKLTYDARKEASVCSNNTDRDHYILWDDGAISIEIGDVLFEFYPRYNDTINKCRIFLNHLDVNYGPVYSIDSWIYVDKDNYLQVIEKIKNLQVLK